MRTIQLTVANSQHFGGFLERGRRRDRRRLSRSLQCRYRKSARGIRHRARDADRARIRCAWTTHAALAALRGRDEAAASYHRRRRTGRNDTGAPSRFSRRRCVSLRRSRTHAISYARPQRTQALRHRHRVVADFRQQCRSRYVARVYPASVGSRRQFYRYRQRIREGRCRRSACADRERAQSRRAGLGNQGLLSDGRERQRARPLA